MSNVGPIHSISPTPGRQPLGDPSQNGVARPEHTGPSAGADRVDLSEAARLSSRLDNLPPERAEKIAEIRRAIADGTYESPEKIAMAVEAIRERLNES